MNALAKVDGNFLPAMVERAAHALASAKTAAEVMEARDLAGVSYDAAKRAARFAKAKGAHDTLVSAAHRAQADALEIEAGAKRRLADEYDAAQERGEVAGQGKPKNITEQNVLPKAADIGLTAKQIHEAREIRDAEKSDPGVVRRVLDEAIAAGEEPTRAKVKRAVRVRRQVKAKSRRKRTAKRPSEARAESQHERDLRMLFGVWEATCESARAEFLKIVQQ